MRIGNPGFLSALLAAARSMNRSPQLTVLAVLTLAIGMGAATAIFSVVNATFLTPLPFSEPERLVFLGGYAETEGGRQIRGGSYAEVMDWRARNTTLTDVAAVDGGALTVGGEQGAEQVDAEIVTGTYFDIVGVGALVGRVFGEDADDPASQQAVAVVSERFARRRFPSIQAALDQDIRVNGRPHRIVGVMPPGFHGTSLDAELWLPAGTAWAIGAWPADPETRSARWLGAVGRLAPGVSAEQAQSDLDAVAAQLTELYPENNTERGVLATPVRDVYTDGADIMVLLLSGAVGLLMLIACGNTANLLLFRAAARSRDLLIRVAVGARRRHLVRQILAETLYLSLLATLVGAVIAALALSYFAGRLPAGALPDYAVLGFDLRVFGFAVLAAVIGTALAGLAPAIEASRSVTHGALAINTRSAVSGGGQGIRRGLVALQSGMALVLLVGTLLVVQSMRVQLGVDVGFDPEDRIAFRLDLTEDAYPRDAIPAFVRRLEQRLDEIPGVRSAAVGSDMPLRGGYSASILRKSNSEDGIRYYRHHVTSDYMQTLGISLIGGRGLEDTDAERDVVLISRSFAERYFGGQGAVGETLVFYPDLPATVVGVVEDVRYRDLTSDIVLGQDDPDVYMHLLGAPARGLDVVVETARPPEEMAPILRAAVADLDPALPIYDIGPLTADVIQETAQPRLSASLLGAFSGAALLLVAVGLYGVLAAMVKDRARELAVRMAMGATASRVQGMVMKDGLRLVTIGILLGAGFAWGLIRWLTGTLYGLESVGLAIPVAAGIALFAVALVGIYVPARRAAVTDPNQVLGEG